MAVKTKFKIEIPEEVQTVINGLGYTVKDWLKIQMTGLLRGVQKNKEKDLLKDKLSEINTHVNLVRGKIKVDEA